MKKLFQLNLLLLLISSATAQELPAQEKILREFDWKDLSVQSTNCQIVSMDGVSVLKIENTNANLMTISLLKIINSADLKKAAFVVTEIKYKMVGPSRDLFQINGNGKLVANSLFLLNQFPPAAAGGDDRLLQSATAPEFGRGGNSSGEINGESNWRPCRFAVVKLDTKPTQLELKLFLSESGTIYIRPIKLLETTSSSNWWSPQQTGMVGGIFGAIVGCLGGLIGILGSKGKARNFVLATIKIFIALGIILLVAGVVAIALQQPYEVWYSLLLPGFILTLVFSLNLPSIQRRYDELEIRRMTSIDTMRS